MADKGLSFAEAGVETARPGADAEIGGFGALFDRNGEVVPVETAAPRLTYSGYLELAR